MLYWSYASETCRQAGALPPESLALPYGRRSDTSPFGRKDYADVWRTLEAGYETQPGDCPPIRLIAHYGFVVLCPEQVVLRRLEERAHERLIEPGRARFGWADIGGSSWPHSDSGLVASWIAGSEYVKIQTGIVVYYPKRYYLYQGPLPNHDLLPSSTPQIMAGLDYAMPQRATTIEGESYAMADINVIVRLPEVGMVVQVEKGEALVWLLPVPHKGILHLEPFP